MTFPNAIFSARRITIAPLTVLLGYGVIFLQHPQALPVRGFAGLMGTLDALLLGLVQGLTEFLPVSSSGHLEIGKALLGVEGGGLAFSVVVHGATALSTVVVFRRDIASLLAGLFQAGTEGQVARRFAGLIVVSMLPVGVVGLLFKDAIEARLDGIWTRWVLALLFTAAGCWLGPNVMVAPVGRWGGCKRSWIGCAQAVAVLPGISRSGATIATALLLGVDREEAARFSFLMVLPPILRGDVGDEGLVEMARVRRRTRLDLWPSAHWPRLQRLVGVSVHDFLGEAQWPHRLSPFTVPWRAVPPCFPLIPMSPRYSLLILLAVLVTACNPSVQFDEPMPPSRWNLSNIPKAFRGDVARPGRRVWFIGKARTPSAPKTEGEQTLVNGEDFLLRRMAGHLVVSQPVAETGQWEVIVLRKQGTRWCWVNLKTTTPCWCASRPCWRRIRNIEAGTPSYKYTLLSPSAKEFKVLLKEQLYEEGDPVAFAEREVITP